MDFTRCYGCMRELPALGAVCPHCGYDNTNDPGKQPSHVLPCGTILNGQYMLGRSLSQGGFGITYIGWDLNLEIPLCIKEYYPEGSAMRSATQSHAVYWGTSENAQEKKENRKDFVKEAQKAVKLRDLTHVVTVWGVFYENETAYIVMDYIEGETLKRRMVRTQKTFSEEACVELLTPIIEDLEKAHARGIIHRDIKPDNIMLTKDGRPVLLDMGAAKDLGKRSGTSSTVAAVSQGFSPKEQYRQKGNIGSWTDVYAMCATIYYCVSGKVPPDSLDRDEGDEIDLRMFTPSFAAVLEKGMALKVEDRIQTMGELLKALRGQEPDTQEQDYQRAKGLMDSGDKNSLLAARGIFTALGGYRDAAALAESCEKRLEEIEKKSDSAKGGNVGGNGKTGSGNSPIRKLAVPIVAGALLLGAGGCYIGMHRNEPIKPTPAPYQVERIESPAPSDLPKAQSTENAASLYRKGIESRSKKDYSAALGYFMDAVDAGNYEGLDRITELYQAGFFTDSDKTRLLEHFNPDASDVSDASLVFTGIKFRRGLGVDTDYGKAMEWYEKAANAGNAYAMNDIGYMYRYGYGVTKDYGKAMEWYEKAADAGNASAMNNIGNMYEHGYGVTKDYGKAMEWYEKAADAGYALAMYNVGNMYENGNGVPTDYGKAMEWYEKAADAGYALAMNNIGAMYYNGNGVPKDYGKAMEWFKKAADAGNALAMSNIGVMYYNGNGVPKDYGKAMEWYEKAADAGNDSAMNKIGKMYENGYGVNKDSVKAEEWYQKAKDAGYTD